MNERNLESIEILIAFNEIRNQVRNDNTALCSKRISVKRIPEHIKALVVALYLKFDCSAIKIAEESEH